MKKLVVIGMAALLGFSGFSYLSKSWDRSRFESEIDSLMMVAQGLSSRTAPALFINKAGQFNITLHEEDIRFEVKKIDGDSTTSKMLSEKGLSGETYQAHLDLNYSQTLWGASRTYSLSRTRTFTKAASVPASPPPLSSPLFED
ncbi:MAG TPA: hypothetical protein VLB09_05025 [Nitrospiria bacterium]|nr:hypothetical protein [Nitrospiria bacterium]